MGDNEGAKLQGNDKLFGILAYIFILWIIGLVVAPEKDHAFVKNHVNNGILLTIASVIVTILSKIPFIGWIIGLILGIGLFVLWLLAIIAAIQGNKYKFPFIGDSLVFIK
ncbi:MAG: hypothetical protein IKI90_03110 [Treponema sp.]|nr:hypothetical protein [Treponema sp.]MBR4004818.1 hypothetical protein [Treponema sp.]